MGLSTFTPTQLKETSDLIVNDYIHELTFSQEKVSQDISSKTDLSGGTLQAESEAIVSILEDDYVSDRERSLSNGDPLLKAIIDKAAGRDGYQALRERANFFADQVQHPYWSKINGWLPGNPSGIPQDEAVKTLVNLPKIPVSLIPKFKAIVHADSSLDGQISPLLKNNDKFLPLDSEDKKFLNALIEDNNSSDEDRSQAIALLELNKINLQPLINELNDKVTTLLTQTEGKHTVLKKDVGIGDNLDEDEVNIDTDAKIYDLGKTIQILSAFGTQASVVLEPLKTILNGEYETSLKQGAILGICRIDSRGIKALEEFKNRKDLPPEVKQDIQDLMDAVRPVYIQ